MDNSTITYVQSKNQLDVYNKILKKTIREAKTIYYNNEFDKNKNNNSTCLGNHKWNYIEEKQKGKLHKNYNKRRKTNSRPLKKS